MTVEVHPVVGIPEIVAGDDLAALVAAALPVPLRDGDVVVITQKAVSKAEGRVVDAADGKERWIERETKRVVARRGELVISETRHGFVCANAGVDASNVAEGFLSLLPEDPDGSAAGIQRGLRERTGRDLGVVITDTFGRPWRRGLVEVAIGCAGLPALVDLRGTGDTHGRELETTMLAHGDAVATAAGLVMGKSAGVPAAVVRGASIEAPAGTARDLIRPPEEDMFRHSPLQAISARRTVRSFGEGTVPREVLVEAAGAALTAPVPHGSRHPTRPWTWVVLESAAAKRSLLDAMASAWVRDLRGDGTEEAVIARRVARSDALLGAAPALAVPFLSLGHADEYPDDRRAQAERDMFVLATGASVQNLMLALHARGVASAWVSSSMFCREETADALGLDRTWLAMGTVAAGPPPEDPPSPRPPIDPSPHLDIREPPGDRRSIEWGPASMAKKRSKKRRPPPRRPAQAAAGRAAGGKVEEEERSTSRRAERKEEARRERERRIKQARRRQRTRRLVRWGIVVAVIAGIAGFVWYQARQGARQQAIAAEAADRLGCTPVEEQDDLGREHTPPFVEGTDGVPSTSGSHTSALPAEPKIYSQPVPDANAVHNLEHGYVLVYYADQGPGALPEPIVSTLEDLVRDESEVLMAPYEGLSGSLTLAAWNTLQTCSPEGSPDAGDARAVTQAFIDEWKNSDRSPEPGVS